MSSKKERDIKGVISREKRYSTLAREEGDYAEKQAIKEKREGLREMAKDSTREALISYVFAKRREIAEREKKMLRGKT